MKLRRSTLFDAISSSLLKPPVQPRTCRGTSLFNSFRINTYRSLSKQRTLTIFRMKYFQKHGSRRWVNQLAIRGTSEENAAGISFESSVRPIAPGDPRCNNAPGARILRHPRETTPLHPVSNRSERTSVTATAQRRPGLQVVPGSTVLTVDRSRVARIGIQIIDAEKHRVGKAGSVRMG